MSNEALVQRIREQFEQWVVANFPGTPPAVVLSREESGDYSRIGIQGRWEAWQAALSAPPSAAPVAQEAVVQEVWAIHSSANGGGYLNQSGWITLFDERRANEFCIGMPQCSPRKLLLCEAAPIAQEGAAGRACTCHPEDARPYPCAEQYAFSECEALATLRAQLEERDGQLASVKESARKASSAIQMIPAAPDGRLPHIGSAIRYLNEIAGLGGAALVTMPIGCAQCGEEHQNNTKEAWAIIQLGCCIKCASRQAEKLAASEARVEAVEAESEELCNLLVKIGNYAHDHSTGPAVPDALWEIRDMAFSDAALSQSNGGEVGG